MLTSEAKRRYVPVTYKRVQYKFTGPYGAGLQCKNYFWDLETGLRVTGSALITNEWPGWSNTFTLKKSNFRGVPGKDDTSFVKLSRNGRIVMKPYSISGYNEEELYVVGITKRAHKWCAYLEMYGHYPCAGPFIEEESVYERFIAASFADPKFKIYKCEPLGQADISGTIARLQGDVVMESYRSFDLLTQLVEIRETASLILKYVHAFTKDFPKYLREFSAKEVRKDPSVRRKFESLKDLSKRLYQDYFVKKDGLLKEHNLRLVSYQTALLKTDVNDRSSREIIRSHIRLEERKLRATKRSLNRELRLLQVKLKKERDGLTTEVDDLIAQKWLEYRYGWMPLVLGVEEGIKYFRDLNNEYKTVRKGKTLTDVVDSFQGDLAETYKYERITRTFKIGVVGKSFWNSNARGLRFLDDLGFNPLNTAWELIPLSFVVDWFANVQAKIFSLTAGLVDNATQRAFCYSVKETVSKETMIYRPAYVLKEAYTVRGYWNKASVLSEKTVTKDIEIPMLHGAIHRRTDESFNRYLFNAGDIPLVVEPEINVKRFLDALALLHERNKTALQSLKGRKALK